MTTLSSNNITNSAWVRAAVCQRHWSRVKIQEEKELGEIQMELVNLQSDLAQVQRDVVEVQIWWKCRGT